MISWPVPSPAIRQVVSGTPSSMLSPSYVTGLPSVSWPGGAVSGTATVAVDVTSPGSLGAEVSADFEGVGLGCAGPLPAGPLAWSGPSLSPESRSQPPRQAISTSARTTPIQTPYAGPDRRWSLAASTGTGAIEAVGVGSGPESASSANSAEPGRRWRSAGGRRGRRNVGPCGSLGSRRHVGVDGVTAVGAVAADAQLVAAVDAVLHGSPPGPATRILGARLMVGLRAPERVPATPSAAALRKRTTGHPPDDRHARGTGQSSTGI